MDQGIHRLIYHYLYHKEQVILVVNRPPFIAPSKNTSRGGQKYITLFSNIILKKAACLWKEKLGKNNYRLAV
jgi:hypothetical protein